MMEAKPPLLSILDGLAVVVLLIATAMVFFYAPLEAIMGAVQKVFYFHVAAGWVGMLGFLTAAITGIIFLRTGVRKWDLCSFAAVEIGIVFAFINVVSGSIWARPIWNTWWTWDPRLTTATIMILIYAAYFLLRSGVEDPDRRGRFGAIYTVVGFLSVPLTFFSARLFRTIHPIIIGTNQPGSTGAFDMAPMMLQTLLVSLLAFSLIFFDLLWRRVRLGRLQSAVEQLKNRSGASEGG